MVKQIPLHDLGNPAFVLLPSTPPEQLHFVDVEYPQCYVTRSGKGVEFYTLRRLLLSEQERRVCDWICLVKCRLDKPSLGKWKYYRRYGLKGFLWECPILQSCIRGPRYGPQICNHLLSLVLIYEMIQQGVQSTRQNVILQKYITLQM